MRNYRNSDYAKNKKNKNAIIYTHNDKTEKIDLEKIIVSGNRITETEFQIFKNVSDKLFEIIEKKDRVEERRYSCSIDEISDLIQFSSISAENEYIEELTKREKKKKCNLAISSLSDIQKRRMILLAAGMSYQEIADFEGCKKNAVKKSIDQVRKKFLKFFPERGCTKRQKKGV